MSTIPPILLVGFGKMGGAMLAGWREQGLSHAIAIDPACPPSPGPDVTVVASAADIPADFVPAAVVLAVKPQNAADTLPLYARYAVRAMPNTPAAVRQGITVCCPGPGVTPAQRGLCDTLLKAIGDVAWVDDEGLIDPVTAVSGGGPAYVFLLAELLEKAASEQGSPPELARLMARKTVSGSGALLAASTEDAAQLRINVTSPKGTTERALAVMMEVSAWPDTISRAIAAATARSRELAG